MKVYISGKITDTTDYVERFAKAEEMLLGKGYEVVNPVTANEHLPEDTPWRVYMGESLKLLCDCDAIYLLKDWVCSRGASVELMTAQAMFMRVLTEETA